LRNLTGWGDAVNLTLQGSDGQEAYSLAWQMPLTARGTTVSLASYRSNASVMEEPLDRLDIRSRSEGWELGLGHALVHSVTQRLTLGLAYTGRTSSTTLGGMPFAFSAGAADGRNRVSEWRLHQEYLLRQERASYAMRSTFVGGENNAALSSAIDSQPRRRYLTWVGQAQASVATSARSQVLLRASAQWSDGNLVPMGQYALGGAATVRGYRENQLVRDRGWNGSIEYRRTLMTGAETDFRLTLFPFVDYGEARNAGQRPDALSSVGAGIALHYRGLEAELALAHRVAKPAVTTSGALQDDGIHFQIRYRFF
jgi:hemolysin activation/secretion protein